MKGAKVHYIKHSVNEFIKGRNYINETVNVFVLLQLRGIKGYARFKFTKFNG
ncbi:hypothetical protein [Campylobacter troglodytis]|uniref:hypothetical protein n=1 Tax=Campylobacter troglodytis TaxID=654363 RepID=UPI00163BCBFB|nr:hypothetical protein [Campylobacter troglodytis]